MVGFSETQNSICFCRGGFEKLEASIFLHWMQLWVASKMPYVLFEEQYKEMFLPPFLPSYRYKTSAVCQAHAGGTKMKKVQYLPWEVIVRKENSSTYSYSSVDGWNGVCQMNKEKRNFSNKSQQPVQGQGGIRAFPLLIQQVFFACLLWDTHCEWSRFESILWPEHVGGERWKMSLSYFCSSLMLMN